MFSYSKIPYKVTVMNAIVMVLVIKAIDVKNTAVMIAGQEFLP